MPITSGNCRQAQQASRLIGSRQVSRPLAAVPPLLRSARSPHIDLAVGPSCRKPQPPPLRYRNADDDRSQSAVGSILSTSSVDEMLHSAHLLINRAERRIGDYCSTFTPPAGTAPSSSSTGTAASKHERRCWHVYRSLHQAARRMEAAAGAEAVTTGHAGPACADVAALERLIRELEYVPVEDMIRVLAANRALLGSLSGKREDRHARDRHGDTGTGAAASRDSDVVAHDREQGKDGVVAEGGLHVDQPSRPCHGWLDEELLEQEEDEDSSTENAPGAAAAAAGAEASASVTAAAPPAVVSGLDRQRAEAVFATLDRQGRGWVDRDDLLAGLQLMGEHLDMSDIEQVCIELGATGRIDMQTFCDIAEAERLVVPGSDAVFLRHLRHSRPEWWTESPASIDQGM